MASSVSDDFVYQSQSGNIDFDTNTFAIRLMATGFTFNKGTHANWSDVSASELAAGFGYTAGGTTLTGVTITKDTTLHKSVTAWDNVSWTASGGSIGPSPGAIIVKDTGVAATSTIIAFADFVSDQTATDGGTFTVSSISTTLTA